MGKAMAEFTERGEDAGREIGENGLRFGCIIGRGRSSKMFENIHVDVNKLLFSSLDISDYQTIERVELFEHCKAHFFLGGIIWLAFRIIFLTEFFRFL